MALTVLPIRLLCDLASRKNVVDLNTSQGALFYAGDDVEIDIGIGQSNALLTGLTNIAAITCQIFQSENDTNAPMMSCTVNSGFNTGLTQVNWNSGGSANSFCQFKFPNSQTNIISNNATQNSYWIRIVAQTTDSPALQITLLDGPITVLNGPDNTGASPTPPAAWKLVTDVTNGKQGIAILCSDGNYRILQGDVVGGVSSPSLSDQTY